MEKVIGVMLFATAMLTIYFSFFSETKVFVG